MADAHSEITKHLSVEESRVRRHGESERNLVLRGTSITKSRVENGRSQTGREC
jgi:hypothetical protein